MQLQLECCDLDVCDFEECKFGEYRDERDYLADSLPGDASRTAAGLEKGLLLEIYNRDTAKMEYRYCPVGSRPEELRTWLKDRERELRKQAHLSVRAVRYWRLDLYSCVEVPRDRAWFAEALPKMRAFWAEVCYYRAVGAQYLYRDFAKAVPVQAESDSEPEEADQGVQRAVAFLSESDADDVTPSRYKPRRSRKPGSKAGNSPKRSTGGPTGVAFLSDSD